MEKKILIIHVTGRIGDTLYVTTAINAIHNHNPNCKIYVFAHRNTLDLLKNNPSIFKLNAFSSSKARIRGWFSPKFYDLALVFNWDENMIPLIKYGFRMAKKVIAFEQSDNEINQKLFKVIKKPKGNFHALTPYLNLIKSIGIRPTKKRIFYYPTTFELNNAEKFILNNKINNKFLIGFKCSGLKSRNWRDWPIERFSELANKIISKNPNVIFLLFGAEYEIKSLIKLKKMIGGKHVRIIHDLPIRLVAAIMSKIDLYIGVSTGPTHLMSAFDIPIITIWHLKTPSLMGKPLNHPCSEVIDMDKISKSDSLNQISSSKVFAKTKKYL